MSVSLDHYRSGAGFADDAMNQANLSSEQLNNLVKALEAGHLQGGAIGDPNQTNAGALKTESLERNLKNIQFKESDIRFWKRYPKTAAFNTVEEYNQLTSYGEERGGFNREGELPEEENSQYVRKSELVKYLGVTRTVTHQMQLVKTHIGPIIQEETKNGILWILRKANRGLFHGDSALINEEWNSIYAQHMNNDQYATLEAYMSSPHVIDLRGATLKELDIEQGGLTLLNNYAQPNVLVGPPQVLSDFATNFYDRQRLMMGNAANVSNVVSGNHIEKFRSQFGLIDFEYDIFAFKPRSGGVLPNVAATSSKAPATPVAGGTPIAAVADAGNTRFDDGAGDYYYGVSALNRYGESAILDLDTGSAVTVAVTESVDLQFVAGSGAYAPTAYIIYRSKKDPAGTYAETKLYPIMTIPATGNDAKRGSLAAGVDGAAATKVRDRNRWLPGGQDAMLMQMDSEVTEFKQLAPLMKMPLARLSPSERFMVLLYGTPILYQPSKGVRYINVGRDDLGA